MAKTPTYPLGLPTEQRERWQKEAEKRGVSLAEFIRRAVERDICLGPPTEVVHHPAGGAGGAPGGGKVFKGMDMKGKPLR